jgi:hypothetical protein
MTEKTPRQHAWEILTAHKTPEAREQAIKDTVPEGLQEWVRFYVEYWPKLVDTQRRLKRARIEAQERDDEE